MDVRVRTRVALLALGLAFAATAFPAPSWAGAPDDGLRTATFFIGSVGKTGTFPGTLVCLGCDVNPGAAARAQCTREGHRHALRIEGDPQLHPLLTSNEEMLERINSAELHGKTVAVDGVYYPSTGAILVSDVRTVS